MEIDFQPIREALSLAGDTGSAAQKVAGALETIRSLFGSAKVSADPDVKMAMSEMMLQVANTQAANAQLINQLTALEATLKAIQAAQTDFDRYELWKSPASAVVYRLKEGDGLGEPDHFLCPNCIEENRKSILQGSWIAKCPKCGASFQLKPNPPLKTSNKWKNR